jgi:hypothetical protein
MGCRFSGACANQRHAWLDTSYPSAYWAILGAPLPTFLGRGFFWLLFNIETDDHSFIRKSMTDAENSGSLSSKGSRATREQNGRATAMA